MYFLASQVRLDPTTTGVLDRRDVSGLCKKIQGRFSVLARPGQTTEVDGQVSLYVVWLGSHENKLSQLMDSVEDFIESEGYGRVESEQTILESFEALDEYD